MDNAVTTTAPTPLLVPASPGLAARWGTLPARVQTLAVLGVAALLALLVALGFSARDSDYRVLLPNLSEKESGQIVDKLAQMNVPYRFAEGGSTLLVPSSRVGELRVKLAAAGLPAGGAGGNGAAGYELLDTNSFGQTQGQERMKFQRAKEGELIKSIQALDSVKAARVHLALPNQNGFFREQQKPSASVVLTLHPGRVLDRGQIAGIVSLVSSSIPEMTAKAVSVVDSSGALLSAGSDDDTAGLDTQQLQFRREIEAGHLKRVMALLEPVVGRDNVRASITADVDFSQVMQTAEAYRPNQGPDGRAAVREQRVDENGNSGGSTAGGVPGALSNQPQPAASAPINGDAQKLQGAGAGGGSGGSGRREAATRYEVDRTVTVTKNAAGSVRRLSAAVVVNHKTTTDSKGKTSTVPLSTSEIEQLTALVQQGIGFNAERGDAVRVINAPFRVEAVPPAEEPPLWKQPALLDFARSAAGPAALALVALVVVFALVRPAVTAMLAPPPKPEPGSGLNEVVDDVAALPGPDGVLPALAGPASEARLEQVRALARQNPAAVANIVRSWVSGEVA